MAIPVMVNPKPKAFIKSEASRVETSKGTRMGDNTQVPVEQVKSVITDGLEQSNW